MIDYKKILEFVQDCDLFTFYVSTISPLGFQVYANIFVSILQRFIEEFNYN